MSRGQFTTFCVLSLGCVLATLPLCAENFPSRSGRETDDSDARNGKPFGPFPLRHLDSLSLLFYQAAPTTADTLPARTWRLATDAHYASFSTQRFSRGPDGLTGLRLDHEILRLEFHGQWAATDNLELDILLPFHYATRGFLDEITEDFHDFSGLGPTGRINGTFHDELAVNDRVVREQTGDTFLVADLTVGAKYAWLRDATDPLGLAVRAAVELPTGSVDRGNGNGKVDGGIGVVLQKTFDSLTFYLTGDAVFQQTPNRFSDNGVDIEPVVPSAAAAAEWRLRDWVAFSAQTNFANQLFENVDLPALQGPRAFWALGLQFGTKDVRFRAAFLEEVISTSAFDFAVYGGLSYKF